MKTIRASGMAWYRREDYPRILEIMEDRQKLYPDFTSWENAAKSGESSMKREGHIVIRALIDPEKFPEWCRKRGLRIDAQARMQFANEVAYEQMRQTH
ncbi:MAG: hypothetical protein IT536_21320 [Hyphomicrobiales bacterium]|nr:hypothetical protein [Hyphomicrobiales bacterium]